MTETTETSSTASPRNGTPQMVIGAALLVIAFMLPDGSHEAFAKRSVDFEARPGKAGSSCPTVYRDEAVPLVPDTNPMFVRHADRTACRAPKSEFTSYERPARRPLPDNSGIVEFQTTGGGERMNSVNVRYEPKLSDIDSVERSLIYGSISDPESIQPKYLVTGSDGYTWVEAEIGGLGVVYVKCNRLRFRLPNGRIAKREVEFCDNPFSREAE